MSQHPLTLVLRFGLEVAALAAYGVWGWQANTGFLRLVLVVVLPLLMAILWGAFVSPKAFVAAPGVVRLAVEAFVFVGAVVAVYATGAPALAGLFGGLILLQTLLGYDRVALLIRG